MRREDAALARRGQGVVEGDPGGNLLRGELEGRQRRVSLVEVEDAGVDPERAERVHRAEPEQAVLAEARERVALVQPGRDPALDGVVLLELGVEEVERHPSDLRAPDVEGDVAPEEAEGQAERGSVVVEHVHRGQALGHDLCPVLVLQARPIDALLEVALAIEEADADHGQGEVARGLEDVSCERPEAARVDRQRGVDAELGADEDDRAVEALDRRLRTGAVLLQHARESRDPLERRWVRGCDLGRVGREVGELPHRIPRIELPGVRVERAEELVTVGIPRPAVVERDPRERRELGREPQGELGGTLVRLAGAGEGLDIDQARRGHGRAR